MAADTTTLTEKMRAALRISSTSEKITEEINDCIAACKADMKNDGVKVIKETDRKDVLIFTKDKEENLDKVREDIINLAYEPSKYHYFKVYEPKERQIMALPFYDRVVQHAINNVLEPIFDKRFISQSYACRKGKGMHAASDTLKE